MRLRVLVNALSVAPGGGETVARHLLAELAGMSPADEYVVLLKDRTFQRSEVWPENVRFIYGSCLAVRPSTRVIWEQIEMGRLLRRERCDVLFGLAGYGLVARRTPQVVMVQNAYFYVDRSWMDMGNRLRHRVQRILQLASIRAGAYAVCVSDYMSSFVKSRGFLDSTRVVVIPHGTDMTPIGSQDRNSREGVAEIPMSVMWLGTAIRHKGLGDLVAALPAVERTLGRSIELRVAGTFSHSDRQRIEDEASSLGLSVAPRFLGYIDRGMLRSEYLRAATYVSTSEFESFDNGVLEAMAVGVPVVATDIPVRGAARTHIRTYRFGDRRELASVLSGVLLDPAARADMAARGQAFASEFTWSRAATQYREVFRAAIESGPER